jgi:hypothetical protein
LAPSQQPGQPFHWPSGSHQEIPGGKPSGVGQAPGQEREGQASH